MRLTKFKYDKSGNKHYETTDNVSSIEKLGKIEDILERNNIESDLELERLLILGKSAYDRVKLAMGHKVYFISGVKKRKAFLVGYANNGNSLVNLIIRKKDEEVEIPYTHLFISSREAKRARKYRQIYKLNKDQFRLIFGTRPYKTAYLLETVRGTDNFVIVIKPYKTFFKRLTDELYTIDSLKEKYKLDIEKEFKKEREEYLDRTKYLKSKWY